MENNKGLLITLVGTRNESPPVVCVPFVPTENSWIGFEGWMYKVKTAVYDVKVNELAAVTLLVEDADMSVEAFNLASK